VPSELLLFILCSMAGFYCKGKHLKTPAADLPVLQIKSTNQEAPERSLLQFTAIRLYSLFTIAHSDLQLQKPAFAVMKV
jgi:hypothetical protein